MKKYTLVVDFGIPYEEHLTERELMRALADLGRRAHLYPQNDVWIYDGKKDVTNKMFNKYRNRQ